MKKLIFLLLVLPTFSLAQCWRLIDTGENHTLAIRNDGTLWSWGDNAWGKLGQTQTTPSNQVPNQVGTSTNWQSISAGQWNSAGIKTDGTLWAWGENYYGQIGQGNNGTANAALYLFPTQVGTLNNWQFVSVGSDYILAIKTDGTLWGMGINEHGELGAGGFTLYNLPTQIGTDTNWTRVSAGGGISLGLKSNGTIWTWGTGYLGNENTITTSNIPMQIGAEADWGKIADIGTFAIKTNGTLWGWGYNQLGQLGDGTTINRSTPVQIGTNSDWNTISGLFALKNNGTIWAWGTGIPGNGTNQTSYTPFQIGSENNWIEISGGGGFYVSIKSDGTLFCWGYNQSGQIGDGTTVYKSIPTLINCSPLSTENLPNNSFVIYPNPTTDKIFISNTINIAINNVKVMDLTGKVILEKTNNFSEINLQSVQNGIYFLSITSDRKITTYKIVKI